MKVAIAVLGLVLVYLALTGKAAQIIAAFGAPSGVTISTSTNPANPAPPKPSSPAGA